MIFKEKQNRILSVTVKVLNNYDNYKLKDMESGKFVGDLPVDKGAARKWMLGLTAALSAASYGVMWLLWLARIL